MDKVQNKQKDNRERGDDNQSINKMTTYMNNYYCEMKDKIGIYAPRHDDEQRPKLDDAMRTLKPNSDPRKFASTMKAENNIHIDVAN